MDIPNPNKPGAEIARANMAIREALSQLEGVDTRRVEFMDKLARGRVEGPINKEPHKIYAWQQETVAALFEAVVRQQERIELLEAAVKKSGE